MNEWVKVDVSPAMLRLLKEEGVFEQFVAKVQSDLWKEYLRRVDAQITGVPE